MTERDKRLDTPASPEAHTLRAELLSGKMRSRAEFDLGDYALEILEGRDALWLIIRRPQSGGIAVRAAYAPGGAARLRKIARKTGEAIHVDFKTAIGKHGLVVALHPGPMPLICVTTCLTPVAPLVVPYLPRDIYPLDGKDDPLGTIGTVDASQRGLNAGLCYFRLQEPAFGSVLYFQNLTALNPFVAATKSKPDGAVGGEWPELGYLPATRPESVASTDPLAAGVEVTISDALIVLHAECDADGPELAKRFLHMLGVVFRHIDHPQTEYRDWVGRAESTVRDLDKAPEATVRHYGFRYVRPYTNAEYPDVMVQLTIVAALNDLAGWRGTPEPLAAEFARGLVKFRDTRLGTMRRYLPNVGKDKDKDAVDSWYLYHPLLNLGRLAMRGDARAKRLLLASLDYAIKAARHFDYKWPIQFKVDSFAVIVEARNDDGLGQTDVGGLYAYVMIQAFELTRDERYFDEARAAIDAASDMRFELNYQANLTAWGAAACVRLWRITAEDRYLQQSYVYLASFFHNSIIWESEIDGASHYSTFLGVTALHDGPYMALFECFDSFAAFESLLKDAGGQMLPEARLLVSQYCKYALHRAWFYFPDALPAELLATNIRNGHIDRGLSFPLEDLYADGQPAGQVGQEIYGAGAAMVFACRAFHNIDGAPFRLFCDHFLVALDVGPGRSASFIATGVEGWPVTISLIWLPRRKLAGLKICCEGEDATIPAHTRGPDRFEYRVPANLRVTISWA